MSNATQLEMKTKFSLEVQRLEDKLTDTISTFGMKIRKFENEHELNNGRIIDFNAYLQEMQKISKQTFDSTVKHSVQIHKLIETKVEQKDFEFTREDHREQIETIRFATYDNFRVVRATDNYIEKYLPFATQSLISRNMASFLRNQYGAVDN